MKYLKSYKIWIGIVISCILAYSLIGFLFVPYYVKNILPNTLKKELNIQFSTKEAKFNPYTFELILSNPSLKSKNEKPIFDSKKLVARLKMREIFSKNIFFEKLILNEPQIFTTINKKGNLNLLELKNKSSEDKNAKKTNTWELIISLLDIKNAKLQFKDEREKNPFHFSLEQLNYKVQNLSTKKGDTSTQKLDTKSKNADNLSWDGTLSLNPLKTEGTINIKGISVEKFWKYGLGQENFYPKKALSDISLHYKASIEENGFNAIIDDININSKKIEIYKQKEKIAELENIGLNDFAISFNLTKTNKKIILNKGNLNIQKTQSFLQDMKFNASNLALKDIVFSYIFGKNIEGKINLISLKNGDFDILKNIKGKINGIKLDKFTLNTEGKNTKILLEKLALNGSNLSKDEFNASFKALNINKPNFSNEGNNSFKLNLPNTNLDNFKLTLKEDKNPLLSFEKFSLESALLDKEKIHAKSANVKDFSLHAILQKNGKFNFTKEGSEENQTSSKPFIFTFDKFTLNSKNIIFEDKSLDTAFSQKITSLDLSLDNLSNVKDLKTKFSLKAKNNKELNLKTNGDFIKNPLKVNANFTLDFTKLDKFQPYLKKQINAILKSGIINAKGNVKLAKSNIDLSSNVNLNKVLVNSKDDKKIFSLDKLLLQKLKFSSNKNALTINNLDLVKANLDLAIAKNGTTNFSNLTKENKKSSSKFLLDINNINIQNTSFNIINNALPSPSTLNINAMNVKATSFSSHKQKAMDLSLNGAIVQGGYIKLSTKLIPSDFKKDTTMSTIVKDLKLKPLTPYAQKYLGYNINEGSAILTFKQTIQKGQLKGSNKIDLISPKLGSAVKSKDALQIPLETGLMLLRDDYGNVELDIPLSGNMNDPKFSYGSIVVQAIISIFANIATAPFALLGDIIGIDGDSLKSVDFEPNKSTLVASEEAKIKKYAMILEKRPNLKLTLSGAYDSKTDSTKENQLKTEELIELANKRVQTIKEGLIKAGISEDKLVIKKPISVTGRQNYWVGCKIGIEK